MVETFKDFLPIFIGYFTTRVIDLEESPFLLFAESHLDDPFVIGIFHSVIQEQIDEPSQVLPVRRRKDDIFFDIVGIIDSVFIG